jgi:hypothetical protein
LTDAKQENKEIMQIKAVGVLLALTACAAPEPSRSYVTRSPQNAVAKWQSPPAPAHVEQPCTIRGIPCTQDQLDRMREADELHRIKRDRAATSAAAKGRPTGYIRPGDDQFYVWQQWGDPDRTDYMDSVHGSVEWRFWDSGKAVSLRDGKVDSVHQ